MGLDGGLVVVAVDCIVGDGVGAANTQGESFLVGNCSVNAPAGVACGLSLASSTAARADGGGSGGGSGTGTASGTTPAKAAGGTDEGTTDGRSKGGDTNRPDEPPRPPSPTTATSDGGASTVCEPGSASCVGNGCFLGRPRFGLCCCAQGGSM